MKNTLFAKSVFGQLLEEKGNGMIHPQPGRAWGFLKGVINDPYMDGTNAIEHGLRTARRLLHAINEKGVPTATEFLDVITPHIGDMISWGAIGARTTESQLHRELSSGLSCPIGFKNGTDGNIQIAVDSLLATNESHTFLSIGKDGRVAIVTSRGNPDAHIILRGGNKGVNYNSRSAKEAIDLARKSGVNPSIMIDLSHANALNDDREKDYRGQRTALNSVVSQIQVGAREIMGVMVESHLNEGKQTLIPGETDPMSLRYGVSVTDGCISVNETGEYLQRLAEAQVRRRQKTSHL